MTKVLGQFRKIFPNSKERGLVLCALVSLGMLAAVMSLDPAPRSQNTQPGITASKSMETAIKALRESYLSRGLQFDESIDPNHTALIGVEYSEMVTTLGNADAKRSTTNPNVAGLVVQLLVEAGVRRGDTIAVGCSGSFPAMAVATLAATKALGVHPLMILSLGSSSFGADRIDWTLLDILESLKNKGLMDVSVAGVSLGGADDVGGDFDPETRRVLTEKIRTSGIPIIHEPDLPKNVARRMEIYFGSMPATRIMAFVNIGGSQADLGVDPLVLKLEPGVNREITLPEKEERYGVVFAMAKRHIPVVHLLHIKGLLLKYGLPWDPTPLPKISTEDISQTRSSLDASLVAATSLYFFLIAMIFILYRKEFFGTLS
ncbi:MAG: poly-gamma-glutamate system protein [Ignavibacteriales bacterium]|nr:poly-gamma-glutamate system protein [Ignavibacteriales bacterium]